MSFKQLCVQFKYSAAGQESREFSHYLGTTGHVLLCPTHDQLCTETLRHGHAVDGDLKRQKCPAFVIEREYLDRAAKYTKIQRDFLHLKTTRAE